MWGIPSSLLRRDCCPGQRAIPHSNGESVDVAREVLCRWSSIGQRVIPHSGGGNGAVVWEGLFSVCPDFCSGDEVAPHLWIEVGGPVVAPHVWVGDARFPIVCRSHKPCGNIHNKACRNLFYSLFPQALWERLPQLCLWEHQATLIL